MDTRKKTNQHPSSVASPSPIFMNAIVPFVVLLIVALIFNYIPMEAQLKRIGYIIIGVIAIIMLLRLAGVF